MSKKYQVFLSSTYDDLKEERGLIIQALMAIDCFPSAMEAFHAVDEKQFEFIKKIINDCDYYILIIGGRYGSVADDGLSYTEKEYDYALEKNIPILAFIHENPGKISLEKSEQVLESQQKLKKFIEKVKAGRIVSFWNAGGELPGKVVISLTQTIKTDPAIGWIRADTISNELLIEKNKLMQENKELREIIQEVNKSNNLRDNLAEIDFPFKFKCTYNNGIFDDTCEIKASFNEIFLYIAPYLIDKPHDYQVKRKVEQFLAEKNKLRSNVRLDDQDYQTLIIQLTAYGLVTTKRAQAMNGTPGIFWSITQKGEQYMLEHRTIRKKNNTISTKKTSTIATNMEE